MTTIYEHVQGASLGTVLAGQSIIDHPALSIHTLEEAQAFLECYGYDLEIDKKEIASLRLKALKFLQNTLLDDSFPIPETIRNTEDIRHLLMWASNNHKSSRALWSCSLLRIMHTISHCSSFFNDHYQHEIRHQIVARIEKHITKDDAGRIFLGDIELADFQCRPCKTQESATLKLLHKPENVTADIFDWIGLRFITKYRLDAIKVLVFLRENNAVMFANVKPSRSRNSLLDIEWMKKQFLDTNYEDLKLALEEMDYPQEQGKPIDNVHTTSNYHAVQFTCRQRINILGPRGHRINFFFPFEIQIMDQKSYHESRLGDASHEMYKRRQLETVRKRVLGKLYKKYVEHVQFSK
ncbi:MAG: hypothetical protein COW84_07205 [Gammaproteobacteria bacterium CG22_combo_CG10-13_8_21_14_all_40_8]|nr:MAG: hypothetical protein COW84_07205 [Gammaproteobacteria bacterium CG22_combo_CG10-13_8_21_14_all_40_8]